MPDSCQIGWIFTNMNALRAKRIRRTANTEYSLWSKYNLQAAYTAGLGWTDIGVPRVGNDKQYSCIELIWMRVFRDTEARCMFRLSCRSVLQSQKIKTGIKNRKGRRKGIPPKLGRTRAPPKKPLARDDTLMYLLMYLQTPFSTPQHTNCNRNPQNISRT